MADGKAQVEKIITICKEISGSLEELSGVTPDVSVNATKTLADIVNVLESIQNKVFFRTKTSLNFTIPALSTAERLQEALETSGQGGDFSSVLDELESLENQADILKVKVASQDIVIT